jgi:uncharacterized protein YqhQ
VWAARNEGHPLAELIKKPGLQLQKAATTSEPDEGQLEVAQVAMTELLRLESVAAVEGAAAPGDPAAVEAALPAGAGPGT